MFKGNCGDAMKAYEKILGGKLELMKLSDSPPDQRPPGANPNAVMHAKLTYNGGTIMASDWIAPQPYPGMAGFSIALGYKDVGEAKRVFDALAKDGNVTLPFGKTFFAAGFGMVVDRFGTPWMVNAGDND
jgi:PhnB protein